jgi:carboxypeptidase Q
LRSGQSLGYSARVRFLAFVVCGAIGLFAGTLHAQGGAPPPALLNRATYAAIRDRAMTSDWAWQRLADLTDLIGPRPAGSAQAQAAVEQVAQAMRADGLKVTLQPVRTPHWLRGEERAELVEYAQRPKGITQALRLTTLGGSVATPPEGIVAQVMVVRSFDELTARARAPANEARGRIVLFDVPFDQDLADNGHAGPAYGHAVAYRTAGASAAAKVGALAALVRSVGGANYRLPHAGQMFYEPGVAKIPAAALTAEDSALVARLAKRGNVTLRLVLTPQNLPEVDSFNVLGDLVGSQKPEEFVLVSGHLDSWDLGTGAIDDGAGVVAAMGVAHVFRELKLRPKRTVRVVAWMSEEIGLVGARAYSEALKDKLAQHVAVIESDSGAGRPLGYEAYAAPSTLNSLRSLRDVLAPIGATLLNRSDRPVSSDAIVLQAAGVPGFELMLDGRHYFDYHHTPADTLDKVDPKNLQRMVATMAALTFHLADAPEPPERLPASQP